jgi:class 3 adenylate cyclase
MTASTTTNGPAGDHYLLLADISGYTAFMAGVEVAHGVDFSAGIPAGFGIVGALLDAVVDGVQPDFEIAKLEGDAVFAIAPAGALDTHGDSVLGQLQAVHRAFHERQAVSAANARDHVCVACPAVSTLELKMVLHRGQVVRQTVGASSEVLGPAVNLAHRLLKNSVQAQLGFRPYLLMTDAAADALGLDGVGLEHREEYPDVGTVGGRVVDLTAS